MDTEKTEKTAEDTSTTAENKTSDNKKVFSPLGKYAVVAMLMVSIIVTTAIMLNKQLGTVDEQLAAIESEVAEMNTASSTNTVTTAISQATTSSTAIIETLDTAEAAETEVIPAEVQAAKAQTVEAPSAEVVIENTAKETAPETIISTEQASSTNAAAIEPAVRNNSAADNHVQLTMANRDPERRARIESFKHEQKQHMAEMFAGIKSLEAQQLDKYKTSQDKQIKRLRQRITRQEQLIETLILRNKERVEMRAASMQRSQSNREQMLNRI